MLQTVGKKLCCELQFPAYLDNFAFDLTKIVAGFNLASFLLTSVLTRALLLGLVAFIK
jgi:hypothetical protein